MSDLSIDKPAYCLGQHGEDTVANVYASTPGGKAFLRMFASPEDPPTPMKDGSVFVVLLAGDVAEVRKRAELAGLTVEG
jgi:hypothetical protein